MEGREVYRLKLTTKNGDVRFYLFDSETFFLLKWEGKRKYKDEEVPVESYFRDYHDVGGLQFAFEVDSGTSASDINQKILIDKIELDPELSESRFIKPSAPPISVPPAPAPQETRPAGPPAASLTVPFVPSNAGTPSGTPAPPITDPCLSTAMFYSIASTAFLPPLNPRYASFSMRENEQTCEQEEAGLCADCLHARRIESARGSVFFLCERSLTDPHFPKYPQLPVVSCSGYEKKEERPPGATSR
ncbi:MAG: hypothetical protein ACHQLQ_00780 [Candidatus Acidiferrales bacterium]